MINVAMVGLGWWGRHIVGCLRHNSGKLRVTRGIDIATGRPIGNSPPRTISN